MIHICMASDIVPQAISERQDTARKRAERKRAERLAEIAGACEAHAARLRTVHVDGVPGTLPAPTIADLIITLERASAGLR